MHKKHKKSGGKNKNKHQQQLQLKRSPGDDEQEQKTELIENQQKDESTTPAEEGVEGVPGPVEIRNSEVMGRYLVATRDLRPGEWILRNLEPLVVGPCQGGLPSLCLGCHEPLQLPLRLGFHCPDCGLPLCSSKCPGSYHTSECDLLKEGGATPLAPELLDLRPELYNAIVPLRALALRDSHPDKWTVMMRMEAHNEIRKTRPNIWHANQQLVVEPIRTTWKLADRFSEEEIHTVCGILEVNAFEVGPQGRSVRALYPGAYLMAHDCTPNTSHTDDSTSRLSVRAGLKISKGESITLSYAYTLQGTLRRRQHLREGKFFDCVCRRCSDKTELGTFCSALLCPKCGAPRVLPSDPLNDQAPWECVACGSYSANATSVDLLLRRLGDEAEAIDVDDVPAFEKFLVKYSKLLPPSHYLLLGVKHSLCQLYGKVAEYLISDLSDDMLERKKDICEELMPIFDVLEPGMSRLRGMTLYELHAPLMVLATRAFEARNINKKDLQYQMKKVAQCLEQAAEILKLDPEGSSERQMADAAAQALVQVNEWRKQIANKK
ncbi:SET domain-containing protein SmydA-8 [Neocloeon triangulifer]|uniref:SET domain-containing protein SmydA-8 n=1 Tax=Neocloeon triangulifer TaxID=2078957 RepID=UPI00286F3348|nr:SET domain-containing protein SmydA-8 [Neocloeon triangulifer]